jgi:hypothetical protein
MERKSRGKNEFSYRIEETPRRDNIERMDLKGILERVDQRLLALEMSDNAAQNAAGKPGAISNLRAAVKKGGRRGISTATLKALAPVLEAKAEWLLTGDGKVMDEADAGRLAQRIAEMSEGDAMQLLTWCFQLLEGAPEAQATVAARAVLRAYRTPPSPEGKPLDEDARKNLVALAVRLVRQPAS